MSWRRRARPLRNLGTLSDTINLADDHRDGREVLVDPAAELDQLSLTLVPSASRHRFLTGSDGCSDVSPI